MMTSHLNPERADLMQFAGMARNFVRGAGVWLFDEQGRRFLDAYAQYGVLALGHQHPRVTAAVTAALSRGVPAMVQPYPAAQAEALAAELCRLADGAFSRCVFTTSGAEAVEAAIKLVRMRSGRLQILSAVGSYHGKTLGALAASDRQEFSGQHHHAAVGFSRVEYGDIPALAAYFAEHGAQTAAFIVEPIQGERGVVAPAAGYLAQAQALCRQYGVALIIDEIQTGLYRTGPAFAYQDDGVTPDVLLLAKALGGGVFPLGACLVNAATWDAGFALAHSSTFANNNLACIAGLATLNELRQPAFQANLAATSRQLHAGLAELAARFPASIREVRGRGLMYGIELRAPDPQAGYFLNYLHYQGLAAYLFAAVLAERHGVLVLPTLHDHNVIRIAPPLLIQPQQISELLAGLAATLSLWEAHAADQIVTSLLPAAAPVAAAKPLPRLHLPRSQTPSLHLDYAFLMHPTVVEDIVLNDPSLRRLTAAELAAYCSFTARLPGGVVCPIPEVQVNGARARGALIGLPLLPEQMAERGRKEVSATIAQAVDLAQRHGARVVGLGAFTSIYSHKGAAVCGRGPAITTGNLLTAGMTFAALQAALSRPLADCRVGIVGARGSVGALLAQLLARQAPARLLLVGNPHSGSAAVERLAARLQPLASRPLQTTTDIAELEGCDVILSASSSALPVLDGVRLQPGTLICDVARPFDASPAVRARHDLRVIDAGLVALPDPTLSIGVGNLQGQPAGVALACLSETLLLALAGADGDYGIGDEVDCRDVDAIMQLAAHYGFALAAEER